MNKEVFGKRSGRLKYNKNHLAVVSLNVKMTEAYNCSVLPYVSVCVKESEEDDEITIFWL